MITQINFEITKNNRKADGSYFFIGAGFMVTISKIKSWWISEVTHDLLPYSDADKARGKTLKDCLYNTDIVASCMLDKILILK